MGEHKHKQRQAAIDAARLLGYEIHPAPGVAPGEFRYALLGPDGMWIGAEPLQVETFRFMWVAALYALMRENIDVSVFVSRGDIRACTSSVRSLCKFRADRKRIAKGIAGARRVKPR